MLTWLHFGDLHVTTADQRNHLDLQALIAEANQHLGGIDFAILPGDNADDGDGKYKAKPRNGVDAFILGAWPEKGIIGTQLGPNKNGRKW